MDQIKNLLHPFREDYDIQNNICSLLLALVVIWYIKYTWKRRNAYIYAWKIPGPPSYPIIGASYKLLRRNFELYDLFDELLQYPGITKFWFGNKLWCLIFEPRYLEIVFSSPISIDKPQDYDRVSEILSGGIVSASAEESAPYRQALVPMFSKSALESYIPIFRESGIQFVNVLKGLAGQKNVTWEILTAKYFLDTSCRTILGINIPITHSEPHIEDIGFCIRRIVDLITYRFVRIWYNVRFVWNLSKTKKELDRVVDSYHNQIMLIIKQKQKQKLINESKKIESNCQRENQREDIFELLLNNSQFSEKEAIDLIKTVFAASTDFPSVALCSIFITLGLYPDVQQNVYEEVMEVLKANREIEASDLSRLQYTERVIKETLRIFPPFSIYARETTDDLDIGDYVIPKDTTIIMLPDLIHRNTKYWKDPLSFDPDRFLPEENAKRSPYAYIPFSHGSRNCLGWQHTLINLKIVVATVIKELKIYTEYKSLEEIKRNFKMILTLSEGSKLWFENRK